MESQEAQRDEEEESINIFYSTQKAALSQFHPFNRKMI